MPDGEDQQASETTMNGSTAPRSRRPVHVFALIERLRRYWLGIVAGTLASLPLLRAVGQERSLGWVPTGDSAVIASRAVDVLGSNTPLIGQASMASDSATVHSPGPALYWLLAFPARIGPFWWQPAMMAVVGLLVVVMACVIAEHLAGRWASGLTAALMVLMIRSVDASKLIRPMNPYTGLSLIVGTWFLAWLAASGRRGAYPALILVASAAAQMHLTYALPVAIAVAIATVGLFGRPMLDRLRTTEHVSEGFLRWFIAGIAAACAMWALPIWEQLTASPGNIASILGASGDDTARPGLGEAAGVVAHSVGWPPRFLNREIRDPLPTWLLGPSPFRSVTAAIVIGAAVLVLVDAFRRRDRTVSSGVAIALGAVVSLLLGYSMMPATGTGVLTIFYTMRWMAPVGMLVWLFIAIGAVRSAAARWPRQEMMCERVRTRISASVSYGLIALAALIGAMSAVPAGHEGWGYLPAKALGDAAVRVVEPGERYLVDGDRSLTNLALTPAVVYRLRRAGVSVTMSPALHIWVDPLGDSYAPAGRPCDGRLTIRMLDESSDDPRRILVVEADSDGSGRSRPVELVHDPERLPDSC